MYKSLKVTQVCGGYLVTGDTVKAILNYVCIFLTRFKNSG